MQKFIVAVECAIEHEGRFLLIERPEGKHAAGLLAFPGGKCEVSDGVLGEDVLLNALRREVLEEVGLALDEPIRYVTSSCFVESETGSYVIDAVFHCLLQKAPERLLVNQREVPRYAWLAPDEILKAANCPDWLERYLSGVADLERGHGAS